MWELKEPKPVKLFVGILAADENAMSRARTTIEKRIGKIDLVSEIWPFTQTEYYKEETGENILRQFVSIDELIEPGKLAEIKQINISDDKKLFASDLYRQ
jgi:hypothetical protein